MAGPQVGVEQVTALLIDLVTNPTVIAIVGAILAALGIGVHQRRAGAKAERAKQDKREQKARDISEEVENDIGTIPPSVQRERLSRWSR